MARRVRVLATLGIAMAALAGSATPAAAECDGPVPSFREALSTAERVVIGDVITTHGAGLAEGGPDGLSSRFTLRVLYAPIGRAPAVMEIHDLPTQPCATVVAARIGDRIAIALGAVDFTPPVQVNSVAWIRGTPLNFPGVEVTSTFEIFSLLGLSPPDTAGASNPDSDRIGKGLVVSLVSGILGGMIGLGRCRVPRAIRRP